MVLNYKFIKQIEMSGMKEKYVKPEVQVMEFEVEGVLCSSGDPSGSTSDFGWDDSWPTSSSSIW